MDSREYHVSVAGADNNEGTVEEPLRSVSAAASRADPDDEIVVHEGTYRERVDPPRGGRSEDERIVYRTAEGASVAIKGSEVVDGWERVEGDVWRITLDNSFFGAYNPYDDRIRGDWFEDRGRPHHTGAVYLNGTSLTEAPTRETVLDAEHDRHTWYGDVDDGTTTIWARFGAADVRDELVEVNVRPAVFYPESTGVNYLTVRGFTLGHAATQWAPPTTEQIGLLGTHWSKGWIIENNVISDSRCTGITLGKYGGSVDDTGASADRYNRTIRDALANGWERGSIGHHLVRNNRIHACEQAGIVGSMGAAFSEITGNHIHDINVEGQFGGAEIAGIKIHGAIDTTISGNRVHRSRRGIWLDWMAQGTRVTRNLLYDNDSDDDLFLEVNHGPFVVDNNILLSDTALRNTSQGGAYVHNLVAGDVHQEPVLGRSTPYHKPRTTEIAGLSRIEGGDDRFYNNVFVGRTGLPPDEDAERPVHMAGNVFYEDAKPAPRQGEPNRSTANPEPRLSDDGAGLTLQVAVDEAWADGESRFVTTRLLGSAAVPDAPFTSPDGTTLRIDTDYFDNERDERRPTPGPFEGLEAGRHELEIWPQ